MHHGLGANASLEINLDRAVLWDLDGTLIDSGEFHWKAWRQTMEEEGHPITHVQFLASFGLRNDAILHQWLGPSVSPGHMERIADAKEEIYRGLIRKQGISPLPGAADWMRRLREDGWLQAVASSAPRANIEVVLEALSAAPNFQAIVSAEDVHRGKPDPEVFLTAATRLVVAPGRCIVVEDAAAGVEAARNAGMRSVGVSRDGKPLIADIFVRSLDQLERRAFDSLVGN
jgi:beta-phosphoglucomutase